LKSGLLKNPLGRDMFDIYCGPHALNTWLIQEPIRHCTNRLGGKTLPMVVKSNPIVNLNNMALGKSKNDTHRFMGESIGNNPGT
jgi:hypothetical protein